MPLGQAIVEEGAASSSSLEEEIDKFQFEDEAIVISEAEEEVDEYSCIQTPAQIVTYIGDSLDEEEEMASKTDPSLKELMKNRNKAPSPQDKNKSKPPVNPPPPPPPQLPADLKSKRHIEALEEGEMAPYKGSKQPRQSQDQRSRRSNSVDSREEPPMA